MTETFRAPPSQAELGAVDRSRVLTLIMVDKTQTPKINAVPDPYSSDAAKTYRVVNALCSPYAQNEFVSGNVTTTKWSDGRVEIDLGWDLYDRLCRGPSELALFLHTDKELAGMPDSNGLVGRGFLPKLEEDEDGWYSFEMFAQDVGQAWDKAAADAGHLDAHCGYQGKDMPCSKEEQYQFREQAVFQLAIAGLDAPKLTLDQVLDALQDVPKENRRTITVHGQHVNGMYSALREFMGDDFRPWPALEGEYGHMLDLPSAPLGGSGAKRLRN